MFSRISFFLAALAAAVTTLPASAQQASGTVKFNLLSIEGLVVGKTVRIDGDFASKHGRKVAAPFSFLVPTSDDVLELMDPAPDSGSALVKINFATPDRQPIENIQFVPMTLPLAPAEERMNTLAQLLAGNAFQQAVANRENPTRDVVRAIKLGDYDAVEVIGTYVDARYGAMYLRIVGIANPSGENGIVAIANVVAARQTLPAPNDFPRTRGGVLLKNFRFLEE